MTQVGHCTVEVAISQVQPLARCDVVLAIMCCHHGSEMYPCYFLVRAGLYCRLSQSKGVQELSDIHT